MSLPRRCCQCRQAVLQSAASCDALNRDTCKRTRAHPSDCAVAFVLAGMGNAVKPSVIFTVCPVLRNRAGRSDEGNWALYAKHQIYFVHGVLLSRWHGYSDTNGGRTIYMLTY